jgi:trans-aconitate methyltransferase
MCGIVLGEGNMPWQLMPARVLDTHWTSAGARSVHHINHVFASAENELHTYKMVIDAHRCIDEVKRDYNTGVVEANLYFRWLEGYSLERLKRFLDRTLLNGVLDVFMPIWWTKEHRDA